MFQITDAIRTAYPNPIRGAVKDYHYTDQEYCVGGAICQFFNAWLDPEIPNHFPDTATLAFALLKKNPFLPGDQADISANAIIAANDSGRFDIAWRAAEHALSYGAHVHQERVHP